MSGRLGGSKSAQVSGERASSVVEGGGLPGPITRRDKTHKNFAKLEIDKHRGKTSLTHSLTRSLAHACGLKRAAKYQRQKRRGAGRVGGLCLPPSIPPSSQDACVRGSNEDASVDFKVKIL